MRKSAIYADILDKNIVNIDAFKSTAVANLLIGPTSNHFNPNQGYGYDKNGNLISDAEGRAFTFNADNKQRKVEQNGNLVAEYFFDGQGKRVKKKVYDPNNSTVVTEETVFVYSSGKLIAEYTSAPAPQNPTTSYTATDMLGSPRVITDSFGNVVARRDFRPFGEEVGVDGSYRTNNFYSGASDNIRQKFTGYQKDNETNLDFAEARMYENRHGRFTAVAPLLASGKSANPQTFNRYGYVLNNPLRLTDPGGLQAATPKDDLRPCGGVNCNASFNPKSNTASGIGAPLINLVVDAVNSFVDDLQTFFEPGLQQFADVNRQGGTFDDTSKILGNKGFTARQFFDTSNQFIGEKAQLTLDSLSFIDPSGQANLPQTTFDWSRGRASNFAMGATVFGAITGPLSFGENSFASKGPRAYSVAFEATLDASEFGATRPVQANRANAALSRILESNPKFASQMEAMIPGVTESVSSIGGRKTPANWIWHHAVSDEHTGLGVLRLVPENQHMNSAFQRLFHPGGRGGFFQLRRFRERQ